MARGMGPCMGPNMMQHMGSGMMHGGSDLTQIDPTQVATLKTELGISPAQETAWTKYSNALRDAATAMESARESAKAAADELLTRLDEEQKTKAHEILPGLATSGHGMMGGMTMGDHQQRQ